MKNSINLIPQKERSHSKDNSRVQISINYISGFLIVAIVVGAIFILNISNIKDTQLSDLKTKENQLRHRISSLKAIKKELLTVDSMYTQYKKIQDGTTNQLTVLADLQAIAPPTVSLSNYEYAGGHIKVAAQGSQAIDVAKMLVTLSSLNPNNKHFRNVQVASLAIDSVGNNVQFNVSTDYIK